MDDHPENLLALEAVLEGPGHELVLAHSGAEALRHLLHPDFAVIILDVMMPVMDGFETAALIRQRERSRHTPIIFLTALGRSEEALFRGYDLGAVDYLVKPVVPAVLKSKVAVFVQLKRQAEMLAAKNIELNAMVHELEAFSYSVAHDLRAPLARIDGFSQALLESQNGRLDEEGKRHLNRIGESARRMCQLVDDLLSLSRVTRTEMRRRTGGFERDGEVDRRGACGSGIRIGKRSSSIEPDVIASGDAALLQAAMSNLLENAWKFTGKHVTGAHRIRRDGEGRDKRSISCGTTARASTWRRASACFRPFSAFTRRRSSRAAASAWPRSRES